jgi:alkanesulfonate monooxygenase SsuD/methylene tetrahydromethanopterin reductase-like flavin-dependent oxidoreductase (luciferase family)
VRTRSIRIGHLVTCDPFRHPAVLAKMAATVDVLSEGRLEPGLGWGSVERELETYGIGAGPPKERAARMRETIEILDLMFTGEKFDYEGAAHQLHDAIGRPRPRQEPRPPLHIGGAGPKLTMPMVRDHAEWWNCPTYAVDRLEELRPLAGDARVSIQHPIGLAKNDADTETIQVAERRFGGWGGLLTGTSTEVAAALAAEAAAGVEGFVLQLTDFGAPETIAQFMEEVAPVVRTA